MVAPPESNPPAAAEPTVSPPPTLGELQAQLATAKQQAEEYLNGWKRAKADYLNLKRENEDRGRELYRFAQADVLEQLLPVYNNLQLAVRHIAPTQPELEWVQGVRQVCQQFQQTLATLSVLPISTVGQAFDPNRHQAVAVIAHDGAVSGTILEEVEPGYTLHGQVVMPAKVKVAK